MVKAGTYKAKIKEYGLVPSKSGAPQVKVVFALEDGNTFSFFGNIGTEKQQEFTTKNLLTLGALPSNIEKVEQGLAGGVLNISKVYELVIEDKTYNGKQYTQIKYINDPEARPVQNFIKGNGVLAALKGQAALIAAEGGLSAPKAEAKQADAGF